MKYSWVVIVACSMIVIGGLSVLAPAGYAPIRSSASASGDMYGAYSTESGGSATAGGETMTDVDVDDDTPSMLLEKEPFFADPNAVRAVIKAYPELEKVCAELSARSRLEVRQWLSYKENQDVRVSEIRAMLTQATTELQVLKKVADADGAKRTSAAIDALLIERQARYERLSREIVLQQRKLAAERNSTSTGTSSRTSTRRSTNSRSNYQTRRR